MKQKAVILLSGGLDSSTCLAIAKAEGYECHCISFDYGQKHKIELEYAKQQAALQGAAKHYIIQLDSRGFKGSALTEASINVPKAAPEASQEIPVTYVPARNTIFLSYALGLAEQIEAYNIFIGVNAVDYSGYPDCRPEFINSFEKMANLATKIYVESKNKLQINTPLINLSKADIIKKGQKLGVDYNKTISCYDPTPKGEACGQCDSCKYRSKGFSELNN